MSTGNLFTKIFCPVNFGSKSFIYLFIFFHISFIVTVFSHRKRVKFLLQRSRVQICVHLCHFMENLCYHEHVHTELEQKSILLVSRGFAECCVGCVWVEWRGRAAVGSGKRGRTRDLTKFKLETNSPSVFAVTV